MTTRKGIYQTFEADGTMSADERWQIVTFDDGSLQIDTETVRLRPFPEPRSEAVQLNLHPDMSLDVLTIHGLMGHREARVSAAGDRAHFCWQFTRETHRSEHDWSSRCALDYPSPLFTVALLLRLGLEPGRARSVRLARLDPVTYAPCFADAECARLEDGEHDTRFGRRVLQHFMLAARGEPGGVEVWREPDGVVHDMRTADGRVMILTGVNLLG